MLLIAAAAGVFVSGRALGPAQEAIRVSLSLSDNQMAVLQGPAMALPFVLGALPLGFIIDRYSRAHLLRLFAGACLAGSLATALAPSFITLVVARAIVGFAMIATAIASFSLVADLYAPAERGRAKAGIVVGQYIGASFAFALGGYLINRIGAGHWRAALALLTLIPAAAVTALTWLLREPPRSDIEVEQPTIAETFREVWRYRATVIPLGFGIVIAEMPPFAVSSWAAPMFERKFRLTADVIGVILGAATFVGGLCGPIIGGALADFCQKTGGPQRTISALSIVAMAGAPAALFGLFDHVTMSAIGILLTLVMSSAVVGMGITLFTIVVPNEIRGLCLSLLAAFDSLIAISLAPLMVSAISGAMGGGAMLGPSLATVCGMACVLCATIYFVAGYLYRRRSTRSVAV